MPRLATQDNDVPLERILPPWTSEARRQRALHAPLFGVTVAGDRTYYLSHKGGHFLRLEVRSHSACPLTHRLHGLLCSVLVNEHQVTGDASDVASAMLLHSGAGRP